MSTKAVKKHGPGFPGFNGGGKNVGVCGVCFLRSVRMWNIDSRCDPVKLHPDFFDVLLQPFNVSDPVFDVLLVLEFLA
jgi:hypothetical protein